MTHRDRNSLYAGWVLHPITYRIVLHSEISKVYQSISLLFLCEHYRNPTTKAISDAMARKIWS